MKTVTLRLLFATAGVILSFFALSLLVLLFPEPFGEYHMSHAALYVHTFKYLLWPSLVASRVALDPSWLALPGVAGLIFWAFRRLAHSIDHPYRRAFSVALMLSVLYVGFGWIYVHIWPVPPPALPLGQASDERTFRYDLYFEAFDTGYRWGIFDEFVNYNGLFDPAIRQGWAHGYMMGLAEWDGVLPGISLSRLPHELPTNSKEPVRSFE